MRTGGASRYLQYVAVVTGGDCAAVFCALVVLVAVLWGLECGVMLSCRERGLDPKKTSSSEGA